MDIALLLKMLADILKLCEKTGDMNLKDLIYVSKEKANHINQRFNEVSTACDLEEYLKHKGEIITKADFFSILDDLLTIADLFDAKNLIVKLLVNGTSFQKIFKDFEKDAILTS